MNTPLLEVQEVSRSFPGPAEVLALRSVDLTVHRNDYLSMVGPSGSGKSTLLNILGLLDRPTVGEYRIDGTPTARLATKERARLRARQIGFVFQAFHLLADRSVLDNVLLAMLYSGVPRTERESLARAAVDRVRLTHRLDFFPSALSGGERQRVAVARAVAARPAVLLADEPTGNLDDATSSEVLDLFDELHADGLTLVVITHDAEVAARAGRVVRMDDGRLVPIS